jgi:hypothetical protein
MITPDGTIAWDHLTKKGATMRWRNFWREMQEAWPAWLALGGIAALAGLGVLTAAIFDPSWGHFASGYLQLAGLGVVAWGLADRVGFSGRSILAHWQDWLRRAFVMPEPDLIEAGYDEVPTPSWLGGLGPGIDEGAPLGVQVAELWKALRRVQNQADTLEAKLDAAVRGLRREIEQETRERKEADAAIRADQVTIHVRGWGMELAGVLWVSVGIMLGMLNT